MKVYERVISVYFSQYQMNQINITKVEGSLVIIEKESFNRTQWLPKDSRSIYNALREAEYLLNNFPLNLIVEFTLEELDFLTRYNNTKLALMLGMQRNTLNDYRNTDKKQQVIIVNNSVYVRKGKYNGKSN